MASLPCLHIDTMYSDRAHRLNSPFRCKYGVPGISADMARRDYSDPFPFGPFFIVDISWLLRARL